MVHSLIPRPVRRPRRGAAARRTACLLVAALIAVLAAACGGGQSSGSASGHTTLTFWHYYGDPSTPTGKALADMVDGYEKAHPNVTVTLRFIPFDDFNRTLLQAAAAQGLPDIALINAFDTGLMANGGIVQDLSARVSAWGQQKDYLPTSWATTQVNGKTYGIPHVADAYALYYNTAMFAAAGLQPPTTWTQLQQDAVKLSGKGRYGIAMSGIKGVEGATAPIIRLLADGGSPDKLDSAAGSSMIGSLSTLVRTGGMSKGFLTWGEDDAETQFATGQAAMMINSATYVSTLRKDQPNLKWGVALLPKGSAGNSTFLSAENLTISSQSKHADAAWDLITYMQQPSVLATYLPARNKLPARTDVATTDPIRKVFAQQLRYAWAPSGTLAAQSNKVFTYVQESVQAGLSGTSSATALSNAQKQIDQAMSSS